MGLNSILSKLFGSKSQRDLKEIMPFIEKIKAIYPQVEQLSNDELRNRLQGVRLEIQQTVSDERERIATLKQSIDATPIEHRDKLYNEIDAIEKAIITKLEEALDNALPEVFAIVKDTARRFKENETIQKQGKNPEFLFFILKGLVQEKQEDEVLSIYSKK